MQARRRLESAGRLGSAFLLLVALFGIAACDKDKDVDPPAELVDIQQQLTVKTNWSSLRQSGT